MTHERFEKMRKSRGLIHAAATAALLLLALPVTAQAQPSSAVPQVSATVDRDGATANAQTSGTSHKHCARKRKFPYPLARHAGLRPHHRPSICR